MWDLGDDVGKTTLINANGSPTILEDRAARRIVLVFLRHLA
jgi:hypothetical protein